MCSSYQSQLRAYCIFLHPKILWNLLKPWLAETLTGWKSTCPTVLCLSFLFHNNNSTTINKLKKWIIIPASFRNGNISFTNLEFESWKSGHLNDSVYRKPINRTLKILFIERLDRLLWPIIPDLWKITSFWIKNINARRL